LLSQHIVHDVCIEALFHFLLIFLLSCSPSSVQVLQFFKSVLSFGGSPISVNQNLMYALMVKNYEQINFFHADEIDLPSQVAAEDVAFFAALISLLSDVCDRNVVMQAKCKGLVPIEKAIACMCNKNYPNVLRSAFVDFFTNCYARSFNIPLTQLHLPAVCTVFLEIADNNDGFLFEPEIAEPMLQLLDVMFAHAGGVPFEKYSDSIKQSIQVFEEKKCIYFFCTAVF
jgi:hypothetical protein